MNVLLRKTDGKVLALDPETGEVLTRIESETGTVSWCDNDRFSTEHNHPEGIYWKNMKSAKMQLSKAGHKNITD